MLTKQVVIVNGERITDVGPEGQVRIPAGVQVIDLSQATVVPGLIDMHSHIYNNRRPNMTSERSTLIAINNAQADLHAGFTAMRDMGSHGNGYGDVDVRNAINWGDLDGPRLQVGGPRDRLGAEASRSVGAPQSAREHRHPIGGGGASRRAASTWIAAWIGSSSIRRAAIRSARPAKPRYVLMYPLPVLQALVDETHRLGKKAACHAFGGDGLQFSITAGCDSVEHGYGLTQAQLDEMVKKDLYFDPTLVRYTEPYMDDNDAKNTGGKFRMIPIFDKAVAMAVATKGTEGHGRQWRRRIDVPARDAGARLRGTGQAVGHESGAGHPGGNHRQRRGDGLEGSGRVDRERQVSPISSPSPAIRFRHHRAAARQVRDEGRQGRSQRLHGTHAERDPVAIGMHTRDEEAVFVEASARLHFGVLDLRGTRGRWFGGLGASAARPTLLVSAARADTLVADGEDAERAREFARLFLAHHHLRGGALVRVHRTLPPHVGLGSGTQLALAVARALAELYDVESDARALARAVGRGQAFRDRHLDV